MSARFYIMATAALVALVAVACERSTEGLAPAPATTDPVVFDDNFSSGATYQAFLNSKYDAVDIDFSVKYQGTASLRIVVPDPDPVEWFAGGAFTTSFARDLSGYNAVTFYAIASRNATLDKAGFGNDNTGFSKFEAWRDTASVMELSTTEWRRFVIPIPNPDRLTLEQGLFWFAEGHEDGQGYTLWLDEIKFEFLPGISNPRPWMPSQDVTTFVGATVDVPNTKVTFTVGQEDVTVKHLHGYFDYVSSNDTVATSSNGEIRVVGPGIADITARLGNVDVPGVAQLTSYTPPPTAAPPPPVRDPGDVISLFSGAYNDIPVIHWRAFWSGSFAEVTDITVAGDAVKAYTNLNFAGIEWTQAPNEPDMVFDASGMNFFHMDIWVPEGTNFKIEIVDFGEDGKPGLAPDAIGAFVIPGAGYPELEHGTWMSLDIPLEEFVGLTARSHLAQLVISSAQLPWPPATIVYIDNVFFYK